MTSILKLTQSSSLIFIGTVIKRGTSSVPLPSSDEKLIVVRVDRGLRVDPALGDLKHKFITVAGSGPESLSVGQRAIFFTNSLIQGRGIVAREVDHLDVSQEDITAIIVAELPELHLLDRLRSAELVVEAEVLRIGMVERTSHERDAALWAPAHLRVRRILHGTPRQSTIVHFPTSIGPPWTSAPRFAEHQRGIFILHSHASGDDEGEERTFPAGGLVALDPADFQPESKLSQVERLLVIIESGGIR